jgi:hypothetical protein
MRSRLILIIAALLLCIPAQAAHFVFNPGIFGSNTSSTLNNGLIAYWKLDEPSGTRADSEPTGTAQALTDSGTVGSTPGKIGNAANWPGGVFKNLSRADSADLSIGSSSFTFAGWTYLTDQSQNVTIACKATDTGAGAFEYRLFCPATTRLTLRVGNQAGTFGDVSSAVGSVPLNTPVFFCAIFDAAAGTLSIRINNGSFVSQSYTGGCWDSAAPFYLGFIPNSNPFGGLVDELGFWKRALTVDEADELWASGQGKTCCGF